MEAFSSTVPFPNHSIDELPTFAYKAYQARPAESACSTRKGHASQSRSIGRPVITIIIIGSSSSAKLANPARLSPNAHSPKGGLSQGPGFMLKVAFAWACTCHSRMVQDRPNYIRHISTIQRTITEFTPSSGGSVPFQPSTAGHVLFRAVGRIEVGESGCRRQVEVIVILRLSFPCRLSTSIPCHCPECCDTLQHSPSDHPCETPRNTSTLSAHRISLPNPIYHGPRRR